MLVAALKEAFDRDSTRIEMERSQIEAERQRAEEALRAELRRQAGERALGSAPADRGDGHRRVGAVGGAERLAARDARRRSAGAARRGLAARARRPGDFACRLAARVCVDGRDAPDDRRRGGFRAGRRGAAAPWLLIGALALTAASLLTAL